MRARNDPALSVHPVSAGATTLQERVYQELRHRIISGRFSPGRPVTLRGLADLLGTSPMPVREALRRLVAENALELLPNRRVTVPRMTPAKYADLRDARLSLEPLAAQRALPAVDGRRLSRLRKIDGELDRALEDGHLDTCFQKNYEFHFTLYSCIETPVLLRLIESIWLQTGPFLRYSLGRLGVSIFADRHHEVVLAIEAGDGEALRDAVKNDIRDGMGIIPVEELDDY